MPSRKIPREVQLALRALREYLAGIYGERLRGLYLFGSYAQGDFHPDSDVDVLIALEGMANPGQEIDWIGDGVADIEHFIKSGILPKEMHHWLHRAFEKRQISDYEVFSGISATEVMDLQGKAEEFLKKTGGFLQTF